MTTNNPALLSVFHPQRKPFVRSHTFVDGIGPPPFTYFDETQDHLGALFHALYGWKYSLDFDECEVGASGLGYLSNLTLFNALGGPISVVPAAASVYGAHGVWSVLGNTNPWQIGARTADMDLRGDFLLTAKVAIDHKRLSFFGMSLLNRCIGIKNPSGVRLRNDKTVLMICKTLPLLMFDNLNFVKLNHQKRKQKQHNQSHRN